MTNEKNKIIKLFLIPFSIASILGSIVILADLYGIRSQILAVLYIPVALLSLPWSYPLEFLREDASTMLGNVPAAIIYILLIAVGLSVNVILIYLIFFRKQWKIDYEKRIILAKYLIYLIAGMKILAGLFAGWIFPHLGGHGPLFSWWDLPFIVAGGLIGCIFGYLSLLAAKLMSRQDRIAHTYIYAWCAVMIMIGVIGLASMSVSLRAAPLLITGVIGVVVFFTKRAQDTYKTV